MRKESPSRPTTPHRNNIQKPLIVFNIQLPTGLKKIKYFQTSKTQQLAKEFIQLNNLPEKKFMSVLNFLNQHIIQFHQKRAEGKPAKSTFDTTLKTPERLSPCPSPIRKPLKELKLTKIKKFFSIMDQKDQGVLSWDNLNLRLLQKLKKKRLMDWLLQNVQRSQRLQCKEFVQICLSQEWLMEQIEQIV